jgi:methyl-accepting chemotaxis protein
MKLQQKLKFITGLFILFIIANLATFLYIINHQMTDTAIIGIAARQPILIVKLEKEIKILKHSLDNKYAAQPLQQVERIIRLFDTSLNALENGGMVQNTRGATIQLSPSRGAAKIQLAKVQTQWHQIKSKLMLTLTPQANLNHEIFYEAIEHLTDLWQPLLTESVTAIILLEQASVKKITLLKQLLIVIFVFTLIIVFLSYRWGNQHFIIPINTVLKATDTSNDEAAELVLQLPKSTPHEISQLAHNIHAMHENFHVACQEMHSRNHELSRINQALDNVTTGVLIADSQEKIVYLNGSAQQFFQQYEVAIRQQWSYFQANQVIGHSLAFFHQLLIEKEKTGGKKSILNIGGTQLIIKIVPIISDNTQQIEQLGWVIEFQDRSAEMVIEQEMNAVIHAALQGDFRPRIHLNNQEEGFFKSFSQMLNQTLDLNLQFIEEIIQIFATVAKGDLTQMITQQYPGALEQLKTDINTTISQLTEMLNIVKETAETLIHTAEQFSQDSLDLSQRTEQQAAALEQTAASMEQMTSAVKKNAEHAGKATRLATHASELAGQGGQKISETVTAMTAIEHSSRQISDITSIIDEIAFQTNLLALNAAVEAARAGAHGRGFAVVATEVRHLAQRSAEYANEISELIKNSREKITQGTRLVNKTAQTLEEIITAIREASYVIVEIAASSQEQAAGIEQVNKALMQMDNTTQKNASLAYQAASTSEAMKKQAQYLRQNMSFFKTM